MQRQKETGKTHFRWSVQEKVSLTFKVTFKHLRLQAWERMDSAKARGEHSKQREVQAPTPPGGRAPSKGQQAWSKAGEEMSQVLQGPWVPVRHAHCILRQWEDSEGFLSKKMMIWFMFSKVLFGHCEKNGLNRIRVEGCYAKIQIKLKHGLCNQGVHIWCDTKAGNEWQWYLCALRYMCPRHHSSTKKEKLCLILSPTKLGHVQIKSDE